LRRWAADAAGAVGRHYSYPGQRAFSVAARVVRRFPPPEEVTYRDADGYLRRADLRDHMESLAFVGRHRLPADVAGLLRPGDWAIDVGANVGSVAGQLCKGVGPEGRVWAFEPIPRNVARLEAFRDANRLTQLEVFDCALSATRGTAAIGLPAEGFSGHASFTASWIDKGRLDVRTERLDDLTADLADLDGTRPLRLVKLDVEGFEREVLAGAEATIRRFRPSIYCEFNDIVLQDAGSSSAALLGTFAELGYRVAPAWRAKSARLAGRNLDLLMIP
jgi:FkbM family methyltransferase